VKVSKFARLATCSLSTTSVDALRAAAVALSPSESARMSAAAGGVGHPLHLAVPARRDKGFQPRRRWPGFVDVREAAEVEPEP
jgi:hypothetical protein